MAFGAGSLHYKTASGWPGPVVIRGGWGGNWSFNRSRSNCDFASACVYRCNSSMRPSVVGMYTSTIWMAANSSRTLRAVRPGAESRNRQPSVTCRQYARKLTKMCLDPRFVLVEDRSNRHVPLKMAKGLLDLDQSQIVIPHNRRIGLGQVGPQQVAVLPTMRLPQLVLAAVILPRRP